MFAFHSTYLVPLPKVDIYLEAHRAFLKTLIGKHLVCSGPMVPRTGGFILLMAADKEEALRIMSQDPYAIHGVAKYELIEFELKSSANGFRELLNL